MTSIFLCTDARCLLHAPPKEPTNINKADDGDAGAEEQYVETAPRLTALLERLREMEWTLLQREYPWMSQTTLVQHLARHSTPPSTRRLISLPCRPASRDTILLAHSPDHYNFIQSTALMTNEEHVKLTDPSDLYYNAHTFHAATLAVGGVVECVNACTEKNSQTTRSLALVRPPGHHALRDKPMGKWGRYTRMIKNIQCHQ